MGKKGEKKEKHATVVVSTDQTEVAVIDLQLEKQNYNK